MSAGVVSSQRRWVRDAILALRADRQRSADTHLIPLPLPELPNICVYLKDESIHPSGSLKHRLAHSLFLHALCNGDLTEGMTVVDASSGSTAISEAFFARLLGLPFVAVIPQGTAVGKRVAVEAMGGQVRLVGPGQDSCVVATALAREVGGLFLDQFTNAERATDWRGNNNIAESLFDQLAMEHHPTPSWVIVGAGTGGTSATIGRYIRYQPAFAATGLCVVDPPGSAFFPFYSGQNKSASSCSGVVEGIGRPRVEASFMAQLIDRMIEVPDAASVAAARWLARRTGRRFGPSTGTNLIGALALGCEMRASGKTGSLATLACDNGDRYTDTIYDDAWLAASGLQTAVWDAALDSLEHGRPASFDQLRSAQRDDARSSTPSLSRPPLVR